MIIIGIITMSTVIIIIVIYYCYYHSHVHHRHRHLHDKTAKPYILNQMSHEALLGASGAPRLP